MKPFQFGDTSMKSPSVFIFVTLFVTATSFGAATPPNTAKNEVLRGWLSDEQCAKGRAQAGTYTATNPRCAKECVVAGKKIVLVDPEGKRILVLTNQEIGKKNVGDYVEISGQVDSTAKTLHADSLKFLEKGSAMCGVKPKAKPTP
jgi:hypothetical protein